MVGITRRKEVVEPLKGVEVGEKRRFVGHFGGSGEELGLGF